MSVPEGKPSKTEELLSDEEIRELHRNDPKGAERTEQVAREVRDSTAIDAGLAGDQLRAFLREHG